MANEITLPKLSDTMDEGKVLRWVKQVGDQINAGDVIAEVETDKADMEVEAPAAGVLSEIRVHEGETAAVGAVLAVLDGDSKARGSGVGDRESGADAKRAAASPEAKPAQARPAEAKPAETKPAETKPAETNPAETKPAEQKEESTAPHAKGDEARRPAQPAAPGVTRVLRASPLAQRLARERGVDLGQVRGSGAEGKIVARDVESPKQEAPPAKAEAPAPKETKLQPGRVELSKMRQSIARRMAEAKSSIPHFYVTAEIDMGEAAHLLEALKKQVDAKITVSHLVTKAAAMALLEHPRVNGQWSDGAVVIPEAINVGLAVAVDDGLVVPVIHGCESLSLREVAIEARRLVIAAREGRFSGEDLKGGTFSISNLGILDVDEFSAIINPPQAAILAVGSIKERPVVRNGQLAVGKTMRVTLSCDHRQLNGVEGAQYLDTLRAILENPLQMIV